MKKILFILSILFVSNLININVSAEVNIDLLKQKYPKCEDNSYRHDCFYDFNPTGSKGSRWVGYFKKNLIWEGLVYQNNVLIWEFVNGKRIGKSFCKSSDDGWITCPSGTRFKSITGYKDGKGLQGKYRVEFISGNIYEGEHKNDLRHGIGVFKHSNGDIYSGEYKNGQKSGQGTFIFFNGDKYIGEWKYNTHNGQGTFTWKNGGSYKGEWENDKFSGFGIYTYKDGTVKEGIWKDGKYVYEKKNLTPTLNSKIEGYKTFCTEIGFTPGTEKFGKCVVEVMKKG